MKNIIKYTFIGLVIVSLGFIIWPTNASIISDYILGTFTPPDTVKLQYKFEDPDGDPNKASGKGSGLYLKTPSNIKRETEYNPETNEYTFTERMGNINYHYPRTMSFQEYRKYDFNNSVRSYWLQRARSEKFESQSSITPSLTLGGDVFDKIFGSSTISIVPEGYALLTFGIKTSNVANPSLPERQRKNTTFEFNEEISMNVKGKIGDKLELSTNYNTEATFDFENKMNLGYEGKEDEIIQKIEAGNVSLPLTGSLITGSQSLFGLKTELKFGKLRATTILSQQKGKTSVIEVQGGAQKSSFEISAVD